MRIRHKLTDEVTELDFEIWSEEYIPKKLDANYDILIKDTVFLREILDSGERKFIQERERNNAIKLVTNYPNQFEFVEEYIKVGKTTIRFEATYNMDYDSFKLMFAEHLKDKLDDTYFLVTGKFPPTSNNKKKSISSEQLRLPILNLSDDEKKYLQEVYSRFVVHEDENLKPYTLVAKLWKYPPTNFSPENISPILLNRGIEITPLGIYQIDPKSKLLILVENILHLLRDTIHKNEGVEEVSNRTVLDAFPGTQFNEIYLAFKLIYRLGSFSTGMSHSTNAAILRINSDAIYKNILGFSGLNHYYKNIRIKTDTNSINNGNNDFQLDGLVVNDSTNWFEDARSHLNGKNHIIVWWSKLPSGTDSIGTLKKLRETLKQKGYFDIYYCTQKEAYYKARILDFKTKEDYNIDEWKRKFNNLSLLEFDNYIDNREDKVKSASIVFVTDNIEKIESRIPISQFSFPKNISPPSRNNLQPFISLNIPEGDESTTTQSKTINQIVSSQFIISENVEGVIGVAKQAQEVSTLLVGLKAEQGMMIGIFGRWGRGKTFFWKHMKSYLGALESKPFIFCEFHAWKYQDTPASWAYLYESITKSLVISSDKNRLFGIPKNVLRLNISKRGRLPIVLFVILFLATTIFSFIPIQEKLNFVKWLATIIPISFLVIIYRLYSKHIPKAIDLFKKYSKVVSFKNLLGLQSEIQNELIEVLKASIPDPESQRLLLFVDDLDRCSEDRIIQIIDSLKVMLEDPEISARVVVLTAIDERILKRAIAHKYYDSINRNFIEKAERKKAMEILVREYMDKLFISGIKLTTLSLQEKGEVFDAFSKNQDKVNYKLVTSDMNDEDEIDEDEFHNKTPELVETNLEEIQKVLTSKDSINASHIQFEHADPDYEIEEFEYDYLKLMLKHHIDATPRSIRIYYYRYLLAKKFLIHQLPYGSGLNYVWGIFDQKKILAELIIFYSTEKNLNDLNERLKELELTQDEFAELQLFEKYSFNRLLAIELFKIVEMVVAY